MGRTAHGFRTKKLTRLFVTAALAAAILVSFCLPAFAASSLEMSTAYPGQTVKAGSDVTINLDLNNTGAESCIANLSVVTIPDGWTGYFSGDSTQISSAYVAVGATTGVAFDVSVPADAKEGDYKLVLQAKTDAGLTSTLPLTLTVNEEQAGSSTLNVEYPSQEGTATTSYNFSATLANQTLNTQSYSLSAKYPDGWSVSFTPTGESTQVAAISVDSKQSQGLSVTVKPSENVQAGDYTISLLASSANETLTSDLTVTISQTYSLAMTTQSGVLSFDAHANKASSVTLEITNNSNVALENVNLTSTAPDGWTVTFSQSAIDKLEAGATAEVTAYVTPSKDAMSGDYTATITATTSQTSANTEFRVTVKTETVWGIVGIALIVLMIGGIYLVFRKYGRR